MAGKKFLDQNVYDASLDRMRKLYKNFDDVEVMFSGGKDSTALLYVAKKIAKELNKLPLKVIFVDEEVIHPTTVEYIEKISKDKDLDLKWYCIPFKHRNACSNEQPYWYCWNPDEKNLWVRDLPKKAIIEDKDFVFGMTYAEWCQVKYNNKNSIRVLGIRAQESLRRTRMFTTAAKTKINEDIYITNTVDTVSLYNGTKINTKAFKGYPIYDWNTEDVWKLVQLKEIDYNKTYDYFNRTKLYNKLWSQRVSQPFGEEPLRNMPLYAECFPELWAKMTSRVKGVNSAKLYSNTNIWGVGKLEKPDHLTWKEYMFVALSNYDKKYANKIKGNLNKAIKQHYKQTKDKIDDNYPHVLTGISYKTLTKLVIKGDFKGRTIGGLKTKMESIRRKNKISNISASINHGK